jgi:hypothetical protein
MIRDDLYLFWSSGNRSQEVFRYGEVMAARYGQATADGLQFMKFLPKRDVTLVGVLGEEWRQFLVREPRWLEATDENWPFSGKEAEN